jgi:SAM-dependent methyltransferase
VITEPLKERVLRDKKLRGRLIRAAAQLNRQGVALQVASRRIVRFMNHHLTNEESDRFVVGLAPLHAQIRDILRRQAEEYEYRPYFNGEPYQSLAILGIFGERATEERFDAYELRRHITADDVVLDLGCNAGFVGLLTAYRTGCRVHGIDINPYMIEIGQACARHLRIDDLVTLEACRIQDFEPPQPYTKIFSFATHWTDDENYRVAIEEHLDRMHEWLASRGTLILETHLDDVGDPRFEGAIEAMSDRLMAVERRTFDRGSRGLLFLVKR